MDAYVYIYISKDIARCIRQDIVINIYIYLRK